MKIVGYVFLAIPSVLFLVGLFYGLVFMNTTAVGAYESTLRVASYIFTVGAVFAVLTIPAVIYLSREVDPDLKKRLIAFGSVLPIALYLVTTIILVVLQQGQ